MVIELGATEGQNVALNSCCIRTHDWTWIIETHQQSISISHIRYSPRPRYHPPTAYLNFFLPLQMATAQTARTQYIEANGIRFAYRKFGKDTANGIPLFLHGHFRSNM